MKYLVISQYFWPENFKINDIVGELSRYNSVDVVTSYPNYPTGEIFKHFKNNKKKYNKYLGAKIYNNGPCARRALRLVRSLWLPRCARPGGRWPAILTKPAFGATRS